jgi:hypothetical protein
MPGAYNGFSVGPEEWWTQLENGRNGRNKILDLSRKLV